MNKIFKIILSFMLLCVISCLLYHISQDKPEDIVVNADFVKDDDPDSQEKFFINSDIPLGEYYDGHISRLVDKNGNYINDVEYGTCPGFGEFGNVANTFSQGLACVCIKKDNKDKCGFIDDKGKFVIEPVFDNADNFSNGIAIVSKDSKFGIIQKSRKVKYIDAEIYDFPFGDYFFSSKGLMNKDAKLIYESKGTLEKLPIFDINDDYKIDYNYILDCLDGKCAYVRVKDGKRITPYKYSSDSDNQQAWGSKGFFGKYAQADVESETKKREDGSLWKVLNFIDKSGREVLTTDYIDYESSNIFSEGLMRLAPFDHKTEQQEKYGFINIKGETIIPFEYDNACSFRGGYAIVNRKGKWGYIDKKNKFTLLDYDFQDEYISDICKKYMIKNKKIFKQ